MISLSHKLRQFKHNQGVNYKQRISAQKIMLSTGAQSTFFIRTMHHSRQTTCELPRSPLLVEPSKIEISNYTFDKISVVQLTLHNEQKLPKKFKVTPPNKSSFSVKYGSKEIGGKESVQIFIWFNPPREKAFIQDELIISVQGDPTSVHVPIVCYPKNFMICSESHRSKFSNRENEQGSEKKNRRPSVKFNKRKATRVGTCFRPSIDAVLLMPQDPHYSVIRQFQDRYLDISEYVREKNVKNQVYLGANRLSLCKEKEIKGYSQQVVKAERERLLAEVRSRFETQYQSDGPIVTPGTDCIISWNTERNIHSITFQLAMKKIQDEVRKHVTNLRFQRIQASLKLFQGYKKKEEAQGRKLKIQEYVQYHACRMNQSKSGLDYELQFDRTSVKPSVLPTQSQFKQFQGGFEVTQRMDFDNWIPINILQPQSWEIYQEKQVEMPVIFFHHPTLLNDNKQGAQHQMHYKLSNQTLKQEAQTLTSIFEKQQIDPFSSIDTPQLPFTLFKSQHSIYHSQSEPQEPDLTLESQFMSLGPLHENYWKRGTKVSMQLLESNKSNDI